MSTQIQLQGFLLVGGKCGAGCAGEVPQGCPWLFGELADCGAQYSQLRQQDITLQTLTNVFVDLFPEGQFQQIEFLALRSNAPITLRVNGLPAKVSTNAVFPVAGLNGLTLLGTVDGVALSVAFVTGDDTALEIAARINAAAAFAGATWLPASVNALGQIEIAGKKTGAQGTISAWTGTAADDLGLDTLDPAVGSGSDVPVSGLLLQQFGRNPSGARRLEVSGAASLSVLAAGV